MNGRNSVHEVDEPDFFDILDNHVEPEPTKDYNHR